MTDPVIVALDLGGVIVDVDPLAVARALHLPWADVERAVFSAGLHDDLTVGRVSADVFVSRAAAQLGRSASEVRAAWAEVVTLTVDGRTLVEELVLRGHAVHLWSNTDPIHMDKIARDLPRQVVLETTSFAVGAQKPERSFFERTRRRGDPVVFLDDREENVASARASGVAAHLCMGPREAKRILQEHGLA